MDRVGLLRRLDRLEAEEAERDETTSTQLLCVFSSAYMLRQRSGSVVEDGWVEDVRLDGEGLRSRDETRTGAE